MPNLTADRPPSDSIHGYDYILPLMTVAQHERIVASLTRPAQTEQQPIEIPVGAIENGMAFAERLEMYGFECEGGNILNCSDWQEFRQCFNHLAEWAFTLDVSAAPVAQTEQQPVEVMPFQFKHPGTGDAHAVALTRQEVADGMEDTLYEKLADLICHCEPVGETNVVDCNCDDYIYEFELVNAAPIAQTAPQGKFRMGDLVKKSTGSEWVGRVVGWYSTELTPEGYAVESAAHKGSVQIYQAKALEAV